MLNYQRVYKLVDTEANRGFMVDKCIAGIINNSLITVGPSNKSHGLKEPVELQYFRTYRFIVPHSEFWIHDVLDMTPPSLNLSSNVGWEIWWNQWNLKVASITFELSVGAS